MARAACLVLILAGSLCAQAATQLPAALKGWLRDPAGRPVADAVLEFVPAPTPELPALAGMQAPPPTVRGRSDGAGNFAIPATGPGLLLARTERGLGGLSPHCQPGRAVRLLLEPMAEIASTADGFTLWPAFVDDAAALHHLPPQTGATARLPAGIYEAWFATGAAFGWQRMQLVSAQRVELQATGEPRVLARRGEVVVRPADFPPVELLGPGRAECTLLATAGRSSLFAEWPARGLAVLCGTAPPGRAPIEWPPASLPPPPAGATLQLPGLPAGTAAAVWLLERTVRGSYRVLARAVAATDGRVELPPADAGGDRWLLVLAAGFAPAAVPAPRDGAARALQLRGGRTLLCTVALHDGEPASGIAVDFEPDEAPPATVRARTDDRGFARLLEVAGSGTLRIDDPRYCNVAERVADDATGPLAVKLAIGASIRGRIVRRGEPAAGVTVTLRDPGNRLRPAERCVLTAADGGFHFQGLPDAVPLLLFAQQQVGGATWSMRAEVRAGSDDLVVELRHEDPQILPPAGGR